ncbi:hypothetical protein ACIBL8_45990 [Streptomyces sp. NPDC050523]|uniref:hypothetical protein n=1 Tax=Streptomyces sp. NPDC050523 TaxID=3365622 RepID=UPI00378ACC5E
MNMRGLTVTAVACLTIAGVTGCNDKSADHADKGADSKPSATASSDSGEPEAPAGGKKNGMAKLPPQKILDKAEAALKGAPSLRAVMDSGPQKLDMAMDNKKNCRGTQMKDGIEQELIQRDDVLYMKTSDAFWEAKFKDKAPEIEKLVGDRYVKTSPSDLQMSGGFICGTHFFDVLLFSEMGFKGKPVTKGHPTKIDGVRTIPLKGTIDDEQMTLSVALTGKPYPLRIAGTEKGKSMLMNFTDYGKPVPDDVPAPEDTVDAQEIRKLTGDIQ